MRVLNLKNKIARFFLLAAILYLSWFLLYELLIKPHTLIDEKIIALIVSHAAFLLRLMGFTTYRAVEEDDMQLLGIDGAHPIWIGTPCNALTLFAFFALFVLAFPGAPARKLWFIPLGMLLIHAANLLRVVALVLISFYAPDYLAFNHTYTFTVLVYAIIFALWMWWVRSNTKPAPIREPKS
jgi:exosortase family protein XrtF